MIFVYLASSLYMAGLIWFVQIVHYPLFEAVKDESGEYYRLHSKKTTTVVVVPMLVQMACAIWLAFQPGEYNSNAMHVLLGVVILVWLATFTLSVPQHNILAKGYNDTAVRKLVKTNWIRTVLWSGHAAVLMWVVAKSIG